MIEEIIKNRMQIAGVTQASLSKQVDCSPSQMGLFLNGSGFLSKSALEKTFEVLGINLELYANRLRVAQEAAKRLNVNYKMQDVIEMTKNQMSDITKLDEINSLIDVDEQQFDAIMESGLIDYESTFPYFKATVLHIMGLGKEKATPKKVELSLNKMFNEIGKPCGAINTSFVSTSVGILAMAVSSILSIRSYQKSAVTAFGPILAMTKNLLTKN